MTSQVSSRLALFYCFLKSCLDIHFNIVHHEGFNYGMGCRLSGHVYEWTVHESGGCARSETGRRRTAEILLSTTLEAELFKQHIHVIDLDFRG